MVSAVLPRCPQRVALALCFGVLLAGTRAGAAPDMVRVSGHIPAIVAQSSTLGPIDPSQSLTLDFVLPFRDKANMDEFMSHVSTPGDPKYGQYLTKEQFRARFSPTQDNYNAVVDYANASGLSVTKTVASRKLIQVVAPAGLVESAFHITINTYKAPGGRVFFAPTSEPTFPASIAAKIEGVSGLSNAAIELSHVRRSANAVKQALAAIKHPAQQATGQIKAGGQMSAHLLGATGTGKGEGSAMNGGLTPQDIETAYNLKLYPPANASDTTGYGKGQVLGLFELDTYAPSDILEYEQKYNLPLLVPTDELDPMNPVTPTGGEDEVTLDIELQLAVAPLASKILVYAGGNMNSLVVQQYQKIADDNLATEISTSWGAPEISNDHVSLDGESDAFEQMACQGQSIFAASGDNGAYDGAGTSSTVNMTDATALLVDDPASQPYMCGVGGTTLAVVAPATNENYASESAWGTPDTGSGGGGGGGISRIWGVPFYQKNRVPGPGAIPGDYPTAGTDTTYPSNPVPATHRNVPDVAFDANPDTGYDIVFGGVTDVVLTVGGTSAAAPVWAGFTALVNEQRAANGIHPVGFVNPAIYQLGKLNCHNDFHDIQDGSTNLYFPTVKGYDNAVGFGSFVGANLLTDLGSPAPVTVSVAPGNKKTVLTWSASNHAVQYNIYRAIGTGSLTFLASTTAPTYTDSGLTDGKVYHYAVQSVYSSGQSFLTCPVATTVPEAVKLTYGPYIKTTPGKATITWQTNVLSGSVVHYGTDPTNLTLTQSVTGQTRFHSVTLTGLTSGTVYYYSVASFDDYVTATSATFQFSEP